MAEVLQIRKEVLMLLLLVNQRKKILKSKEATLLTPQKRAVQPVLALLSLELEQVPVIPRAVIR